MFDALKAIIRQFIIDTVFEAAVQSIIDTGLTQPERDALVTRINA